MMNVVSTIRRGHLAAFAAAFAVVLAAVLCASRTRQAAAKAAASASTERFAEQPDEGALAYAPDEGVPYVNDVRSVLYNANGLYGFYSSGEVASLLYQHRADFADFVSYVVSFAPSYMDAYCKPLNNRVTDPGRCGNLYIDNVAAPDAAFSTVSSKERACSTVQGSVSASGDAAATNSLVRVLGCRYRFLKRCVRFDSVKAAPRALPADRGTVRGYTLTVTGYLAGFVLSRPLFLALGPYGLFQVVHSEAGTAFAKFGSAQTTATVAVRPVSRVGDATMHPPATRQLPADGGALAVPVTAYYLSYDRPLQLRSLEGLGAVASDTGNVLTLVLAKDFLDAAVPAGASSVSFALPLGGGSAPGSGFVTATSLSFSYGKAAAAARDVASAGVMYGAAGATAALALPPDFLNQVAGLRKAGVRHTFHVVLTYAMDVALVACFLRVADGSRPDAAYCCRQAVRGGSDYVLLACSTQAVRAALASALSADLAAEADRYREFAPLHGIPDLARTARYLGYDL